MARGHLVKPGGVVAFDVVTDPCLDERTAELWAKVGSIHHVISRDWLVQYLGRRGLELLGSHFTPLPPGTAELMVFRRSVTAGASLMGGLAYAGALAGSGWPFSAPWPNHRESHQPQDLALRTKRPL